MTRKYNMDMLRILSALAVVIIHSVTAPVFGSSVEVDSGIVAVLETTHALVNWSIPVFFMITGYCLLLKENCSYEYCFKHVLKYVVVLFTVGFFYAILEEVFLVRTFQISSIWKSLGNVISGNLWAHMWFVYAIIGIYLVMPVIHVFATQEKQGIFILTGLLFLFSILLPFISSWIYVKADFPFGGYLFYVCFGATIASCKRISRIWYLFYLFGVLSVVWILLGDNKAVFGYSHPATCMIAVSVFVLFCNIKIPPSRVIRVVSECTWGIYLIHPFFINVALRVMKIDLLSSMVYIRIFIFTIIIFLVSLFVTYGLKKIPYVKWLF